MYAKGAKLAQLIFSIKSSTMSSELDMLFIKLNETTQDFISIIQGWTPQQLSARQGADWSANQVIEHLITSETGTLGYMKKKSSSGWDTLEEATEENKTAGKALTTRLSSNQKIVAPSVLAEPSNQFTNEQLIAGWQAQRNELKLFLDNVAPQHYNKLVFRQPAIGMIDIISTMQFMERHVHHHIFQLERIKGTQQL